MVLLWDIFFFWPVEWFQCTCLHEKSAQTEPTRMLLESINKIIAAEIIFGLALNTSHQRSIGNKSIDFNLMLHKMAHRNEQILLTFPYI